MMNSLPIVTFMGKGVADITRRVVITEEMKNAATEYSWHLVNPGQKPEDVAFEYYNDVKYTPILLLLNDIVNPFQWPMSQAELEKYIKKKYDIANIDSVHHYETLPSHPRGEGHIVNKDDPHAYPVSYHQYESRINEANRKIKIVSAEYMGRIYNEIQRKISV